MKGDATAVPCPDIVCHTGRPGEKWVKTSESNLSNARIVPTPLRCHSGGQEAEEALIPGGIAGRPTRSQKQIAKIRGS